MSDYSTFAHTIAGFAIEEMGFCEIERERDWIPELRQWSWSDASSNRICAHARVDENLIAECFNEIETCRRCEGWMDNCGFTGEECRTAFDCN